MPKRAKRGNNKEDARLVEKAKKDKKEFGDLYQKYFSRVYTYLFNRIGKSRDLAEDLAQETFLRAFRRLGRFQSRGYSYLTYLLRISRNLLLNFYRKPKEDRLLSEVAEQIQQEDKGIEQEIDEKLEAELLSKVLSSLSRKEQELVRLYYREHLPLKDVAQKLATSENAIKLRLARIRKKLAAKLETTPAFSARVSKGRRKKVAEKDT